MHGAIQMFKANAGSMIRSLKFPDPSQALLAYINPDNQYQVLGVSASGSACLWDIEDGGLLKVSCCFIRKPGLIIRNGNWGTLLRVPACYR